MNRESAKWTDVAIVIMTMGIEDICPERAAQAGSE
jgi:hypothetical protein